MRTLREMGVEFTDHLYAYEEHGGTGVAARELRVDEHAVVKTLVFEDDRERPAIVLMHGDLEVSTKGLARVARVKSFAPCSPEVVTRHTGYVVGGVSPLATRKTMPIYMERTILDLPTIYLNGGRRGYLMGVAPGDLERILKPVLVSVGIR
ncbi:MAG: aminoacyl-tRNA deacylase [Planctomycetes bacterium]|nr:aminoacyl-tRNA deacylase [Planctomycetota bacterium]